MIDVLYTFNLIKRQTKNFNPAWIKSLYKNTPYKTLISCILSLRTKDSISYQASLRLFSVADTAEKMVKLSLDKIKRLIYPVGFYNKKAKVILDVSKSLIKEFSANVPSKLEDLLKLKGVGRKTANLVLGRAFGKPAICVDTHVHRISNRIGWIKTNNPEQTEKQLQKIFPKRYWIQINPVLVVFGQNICLPISPKCSICIINKYCKKNGVKKFR